MAHKPTVVLEHRKEKARRVTARVVNVTARYLTVRWAGDEIVFRRRDALVVRGPDEWNLSREDLLYYAPQNRQATNEDAESLE